MELEKSRRIYEVLKNETFWVRCVDLNPMPKHVVGTRDSEGNEYPVASLVPIGIRETGIFAYTNENDIPEEFKTDKFHKCDFSYLIKWSATLEKALFDQIYLLLGPEKNGKIAKIFLYDLWNFA